MNNRFKLDGLEYEISSLSMEGKELVGRLTFVQVKLQEPKNNMALLSKAKNSYISDLRLLLICFQS